MANWEIWLDDPQGNRIKVLDEVISFSVMKTTNNRSPFMLVLPETFDASLLRWDGIVEFWRTPQDGSKSLFNLYFIRYIVEEDDMNGRETVAIKGYDMLDLVRRRIVAYDADNAMSGMTDYADDMLKAMFTDNLAGDATDTNRDLSGYGLSAAADLSAAPSITKGFAWAELLPEMQEIAEVSRQNGTELYFDLVPTFGSDQMVDMVFTTWTGQPGQDLTDQVFFGKDWGNLTQVYYELDRMDEINYVYSGGRGLGTDRDVQESSDAARIGDSIWNRCEGFAYATDQETTAGVTSRGESYLEKNRPSRRFGGQLLDAGDFRYGIDWNWGDKVTCAYRGKEFDAVIKTVSISVDESGQEMLDCRVEIDE